MAELALLEQIKSKAQKVKRTIVLPESHDDRILQAAEILVKEEIANVITLGDEDKIRARAGELGADLTGVRIIDPAKSDKLSDFANIFYNKRKHKGVTIDQARETMTDPLYFGSMMVNEGMAHASLAGSIAATGDVMRAGILCVGMKEGISIVSSFFLMVYPDITYAFGDCAVVPNPEAPQLADIAISTVDNFKILTDEEPRVAMLSFSTKGSAKHELVDKVVNATNMVKEKRPDILVDGELQFDAAVVESVGKRKAPDSPVAGRANICIFPDLQAANAGYKIAQRLGGAEAIGPVIQGLKKPCFDLSRGCSVNDIVYTAAIALLMAE